MKKEIVIPKIVLKRIKMAIYTVHNRPSKAGMTCSWQWLQETWMNNNVFRLATELFLRKTI
jgi:hypothetical protein